MQYYVQVKTGARFTERDASEGPFSSRAKAMAIAKKRSLSSRATGTGVVSMKPYGSRSTSTRGFRRSWEAWFVNGRQVRIDDWEHTHGSRKNPKRRNPYGGTCSMKGCRWPAVPGEENCSGHMTESMEDTRHRRLKEERRARQAKREADALSRRNPGLGMPGMPHTWVTAKGVKVKAGDTVEFWARDGGRFDPPRKAHAKVIRMLVFDDHVQVNRGWAGYTVNDENFIRVVRRA